MSQRFYLSVYSSNNFSANLEYLSLSPTKQPAKLSRLLQTLMTFWSHCRLFIIYTSNVLIDGWSFQFRGKNCCKMYLKINRFVKTLRQSPSIGVVLSRLWAPARQHSKLLTFSHSTVLYRGLINFNILCAARYAISHLKRGESFLDLHFLVINFYTYPFCPLSWLTASRRMPSLPPAFNVVEYMQVSKVKPDSK